MSLGDILLLMLGLAVALAGAWWLWAGRGGVFALLRPASVQQNLSQPTRMTVGLAHLVLGYHLMVWALPNQERFIAIRRPAWPWLVLGCASVVAGGLALDRIAPLGDEDEGGGAGEQR